ncbi:MAG: hypothetical protein M3Y87_19680 [Myxococcota bacterium]|nr:hypothetical protein [Myxococcota bacterium]
MPRLFREDFPTTRGTIVERASTDVLPFAQACSSEHALRLAWRDVPTLRTSTTAHHAHVIAALLQARRSGRFGDRGVAALSVESTS